MNRNVGLLKASAANWFKRHRQTYSVEASQIEY